MTAASLLKRGFWELPRSLTCSRFLLLVGCMADLGKGVESPFSARWLARLLFGSGSKVNPEHIDGSNGDVK